MRTKRLAMAVAVLTCVVAVAAQPATAATGTIIHDYEMNEPVGASVMHDSGNTPVDATIGDEVSIGVVYDGATGYRFPRLTPSTPPAHPEHLVSIPDDPTVAPGTDDYSVEIRYRTTNKFGNLIQEGQANTKGGQFKIQLPKGRPSCYYKGSSGRVGIGGPVSLADGAWHVLRCDRTGNAVDLYVDGVRVGHKNGVSGDLANNYPFTVGGKPNCDQIKVTCDYFGGDVDYVKLTKGPPGGAPPGDTTPPAVVATSPAPDATDAPRGGDIAATFSEPVKGVGVSTMVLRKVSTGARFSGAVSYDPASRTATLDPNVSSLPRGTAFTVSLTSGITDSAGNPIAATSWTFTTTG